MVNRSSILGQIFDLQQQALLKYMERYSSILGDLEGILRSVGKPDVSQEEWQQIPEIHRSVFNYFYSDTFSTLISAIRLTLHGMDSDAFSLARIILENLTILDYIIQERLYDDAFKEMEEMYTRNRPLNEFSWKNVLTVLKPDDQRGKLWGALSDSSHASPSRLRHSRIDFGDIAYYNIGVSIENPAVEGTLKFLRNLADYLFQIVILFLDTQKETNA